MTRGKVVAIALVVVVVVVAAAGGGLLFLQHRGARASGPSTVVKPVRAAVPEGAQSAVKVLISAKGRQALTPELNAALPPGHKRLFPAGSRLTLTTGSWHQSGAYANVTGLLREPGKAPTQVEVGLVDRQGGWLVTFEESL